MRGATRAGHGCAPVLTDREWRELRSLLRRVLSATMRGARPCDVEDAVQDALRAIVERGGSYDRQQGEPGPYFAAWARSRSGRSLRRARGRDVLSLDGAPVDDLDRGPSPEVHALASELFDALADAPLDGWQRRAFAAWLEGASEAQIADDLGVNRSSVCRSIREVVLWICRLRAIPPPKQAQDERERTAPVSNIDPRQAGFPFCDDVDLSSIEVRT